MIRIVVQPDAFDTGFELARLSDEAVGAIASFTGIVRGDGGLVALALEHYPAMTELALTNLARDAATRWAVSGIVIYHRVGTLSVGEPIVLVGCASAHRHDALAACAFLIDRLKTDAPFWKQEIFADGCTTWVAARQTDLEASVRWQ